MNSNAHSTPHRPSFHVIRGGRQHSKSKRFPVFLLLVLLGIIAFVLSNALSYDDVVEVDKDGKPVLTPGRKAELDERQKKNREQAEQYVLRAKQPGFRECNLCPSGSVWLNANEIAKIGVSTDRGKRYSAEYYEIHDVSYFMEYRGDLTTAKNKELGRLGSYPLLPENQKRKEKLLYPPLNSKLD